MSIPDAAIEAAAEAFARKRNPKHLTLGDSETLAMRAAIEAAMPLICEAIAQDAVALREGMLGKSQFAYGTVGLKCNDLVTPTRKETAMPAAPKGTEHTTIAEALVAFQAEMPTVGKDRTADVGTYSYRYTDLATLTHEIVPVLNRHGVAFTVTPRATEQGYEVVGLLLHTSGEKIEASLPLYGRSPQDMGSALTYARRYLLGCLTGVATEEDDDASRAKQAERTTAKDWEEVAFRASTITDPDELLAFWGSEEIGKAPVTIQSKVKDYGTVLRKQKELDEIAERENAAAKAEDKADADA